MKTVLVLLKIAWGIVWQCPEILYYMLPRSWRGGYRSPWAQRVALGKVRSQSVGRL